MASQNSESYCSTMASSTARLSDEIFCNRTLDAWGGCWPETRAGEMAVIWCPGHIPIFDTSRQAHKECLEDGRWFLHPETPGGWGNYSQCINRDLIDQQDLAYGPIHAFIGGYTVSIILLIVATAIMCSFRQLRCERNTLHKHLFVSFILNGTCWIMYFTAVMDGHILINNPIWCQVLHCLCQYFAVCNFFWMFCEGFYLHTLIVSAFHTDKLVRLCCAFGWCAPISLTIVYTAIRGTDPAKTSHTIHCWTGHSIYIWILYGPVVASLLANVAFLINIIRVIIMKLRDFDLPNTLQTKKAVRATIILVPLLGLQYFLIPFKPGPESGLQETYSYVSAIVTSMQGAVVALIYCFLNGEVISVIKRRWGQMNLMEGRSVRLHGALVWPPTSMTYVDSAPSDKRDHSVSRSRYTDDAKDAVEMEKLSGLDEVGNHLGRPTNVAKC